MNFKHILLLSILSSGITYGDEFGEIFLEESKIISTTGFETSIKNVASNPTVITAKDIQEKNYQSVDEILSTIPAVNIINQGGDKIIDLRGQGEKAKTNVQVLVDGIQMNSLDTSMTATPINTIDVNSIERIEVIPGGGAVLYGSGTAGGVVNIITKSGQGFRGNLGYRYGEFGSRKFVSSIGESIGKFDFLLDYTNENSNKYRNYDDIDSDYFQGKITYNKNKNENLSLKYSKFKSDESYPGLLSKKDANEDPRDWGRNPGEYNTTDTDKDEVVLTYNNKLTNNLHLNIATFYQKTDTDIAQKNFMMYPVTKFYMEQEATFTDKKYGIKPKLKYTYGDNNSLVLGIDYINNTLDRYVDTLVAPPPFAIKENFKTMNNLEKETISGFLHNTYRYNKFEFTQGIRYEKANYKIKRNSIENKISEGISGNRDENNFAIELAGNYLYSNTGNTYLKYERGFTSPAPALLTNKTLTGYKLNNLKSETYDTFEIGIKDFILNSYVSATSFYTITKDEITSDMTGGMPPDTIDNYNLDKTKRIGFELSAEQWFGKLTLSQSYNYIKTEIEGSRKNGVDYSGNEVADVPKNRFKLGAKYAFTDKINTTLETIYTGASYLNNENTGGKQNEHIVTNLTLNYTLNNGLKLYAGINNLFNEKYYNDIDYSKNKMGKWLYKYDPASERNVYAGFNYSF